MYNHEASPDENKAVLTALHNNSIMKLGALAPESGAYMSEVRYLPSSFHSLAYFPFSNPFFFFLFF